MFACSRGVAMTKGQSEGGAILVAVLLVLTLLAGIAAALVHSGRNALLTLRAEDTLLRRENALHSALASLGGALSPALSAGKRRAQFHPAQSCRCGGDSQSAGHFGADQCQYRADGA